MSQKPQVFRGNAFQTLKGLWGFLKKISSSSFPFGKSLFTRGIIWWEISTDINWRGEGMPQGVQCMERSEDTVKHGFYQSRSPDMVPHCQFEAPCLSLGHSLSIQRVVRSAMQDHHLRRFSVIQPQHRATAENGSPPNARNQAQLLSFKTFLSHLGEWCQYLLNLPHQKPS